MNETYEIGDNVSIKNNDLTGFIDAILMTGSGVEYRFTYWNDDQARVSAWVYGYEIKKLVQ